MKKILIALAVLSAVTTGAFAKSDTDPSCPAYHGNWVNAPTHACFVEIKSHNDHNDFQLFKPKENPKP